jgi:hypothetical protein
MVAHRWGGVGDVRSPRGGWLKVMPLVLLLGQAPYVGYSTQLLMVLGRGTPVDGVSMKDLGRFFTVEPLFAGRPRTLLHRGWQNSSLPDNRGAVM